MARKKKQPAGPPAIILPEEMPPPPSDSTERSVLNAAVSDGDHRRAAALLTMWITPQPLRPLDDCLMSPLPFSERQIVVPQPVELPPLLNVKALLCSTDAWQRSVLLIAARNGDANMAALLLSYGADPTTRGRYGGTPLAAAAPTSPFMAARPAQLVPEDLGAMSSIDVARVLLSFPEVLAAYRDPEYDRDAFGDTVLHHCVRSCNAELAADVLAFGVANPTARNNKGVTARELVADGRMRQVFDDAAAAETRIGGITRLDQYEGGLRRAVETGDLYGIRRLVGLGAQLNDEVTLEAAPLFTPRAALAVAELAFGDKIAAAVSADRPAVVACQMPPLHFAAGVGDVRVVTLLLALGADAAAVASNGERPLARAVAGGHTTVARVLLAHPASHIRGTKRPEDTALLATAAAAGNVELVRLLLLWGVEWDLASALAAARQWDVRNALIAHTEAIRSAHDWVHLATAETPKGTCAVCLVPPPNSADVIAVSCPCGQQYCYDCAVHLAKSALMEGKYPACCVPECNRPLSRDVLLPLLPIADQLVALALAFNQHVAVDRTFRAVCAVCTRVNSTEICFRERDCRYRCEHCSVFLCCVCFAIFPGSDADKLMHKACQPKLVGLANFHEFQELIMAKSQRICPNCGLQGIKDNACTHMGCTKCNEYWCYACGVGRKDLPGGLSIGDHGEYSGRWVDDANLCPMYLAHLKKVDPRVGSAGCGTDVCDNMDHSCGQSNCKAQRDERGHAILASMRVRNFILEFVKKLGMPQFTELVHQFGWREIVDHNFFNGQFPWGRSAASLPDAFEFEPANVRAWYKQRPKFLK